MNHFFNHVIRSTVLSGVILALVGCGAGNSGPSPSTVKRLMANYAYIVVQHEGNTQLKWRACGKFGGKPSRGCIETEKFMEKIEKHKASYIRFIEGNMHDKGCTQVSNNTYNCSVIAGNPKTHDENKLIAKIKKNGRVWTLEKVSYTGWKLVLHILAKILRML